MAQVKTNGISIEYESFGDPAHRPLILIAGLASQMVSWPDVFCRRLAGRGYRVVRFDNRDVGLSSKIEGAGEPDFVHIQKALQAGEPVNVPYRLSDMAADTAGLMDTLNLPRAHVCGISMGGMIAQTMTIEMPARLISMISLSSTTGAPGLPPPKPGVGEALLEPAPPDRSGFIAYMVGLNQLFAGESEAYDAQTQEAMAARAYDRCFYPEGIPRQYAAIMASGSRRQALAGIDVPTLVIHGEADTLLPLAHGQDTADAVPGARFATVKGLGHGTAYPGLWDEMITLVVDHMAGIDG